MVELVNGFDSSLVDEMALKVSVPVSIWHISVWETGTRLQCC